MFWVVCIQVNSSCEAVLVKLSEGVGNSRFKKEASRLWSHPDPAVDSGSFGFVNIRRYCCVRQMPALISADVCELWSLLAVDCVVLR